MLPPFKRINDSSTQTKISSFFQVMAKNKEPDKFASKRLQKALQNKSDIDTVPIESEPKKRDGKSKKKVSKNSKTKVEPKNETKKLGTLKDKVKDQRKKKDAKVPDLFGKEMKISQYFSSAKAISANSHKKANEELICLSEDSDYVDSIS